jgi:hypothetical protein
MAIRTQVTALVLLTSSALIACTAGSAGDGVSTPVATGNVEEPSTQPAPASPKHGRVTTPLNAGRTTTSAFVAKLFDADGGTEAGSDGGTPPPSYDHAYGAPIHFAFSGITATKGSWVGIAPSTDPSAAAWIYGWYAYPQAGATGFDFQNDQLPPGTYVARIFNDAGAMYTQTDETLPFTIGPMESAPTTAGVTITPGLLGENQFGGFEKINVSFNGEPTTQYAVGVFPTYGSNGLPYASVNVTTGSDGHGTAELGELLSGIKYYEIRIFQGGAWKQTSATKFRVNPALAAHVENGSVLVDFAGVQGVSFDDRIELYNTTTSETCPNSKTLDWYWSGTVTLSPCGTGSYEARLYDGVGAPGTIQASASFSIQ